MPYVLTAYDICLLEESIAMRGEEFENGAGNIITTQECYCDIGGK